MLKVVAGLIVITLGGISFTIGLQYASFLQVPGIEGDVRAQYEQASRLFGYGSYALLLCGVVPVVWSIRNYIKGRNRSRLG